MDVDGRFAKVRTALVDALPERLWFFGNLYRVFGRDVHFCVNDGGDRTIEVDGDEVGRGRPIGDVADAPTDARVRLWLQRLDVGWIASGVVLAVVATLTLGRRLTRR